jgi:hypothetical protein
MSTGLTGLRSCMFLQHSISGHSNAPLKRHFGAKSMELPARRYISCRSKQPSPNCRVEKRVAASRLSSDRGSGLHSLECLGLFECSTSPIAKVDQRIENPQQSLSLIES